MSEDNKNNWEQGQDESQNLDFQEAKDMTIEEAVRKDTENKAGITDDDSILDKYIKQHRDEVASQTYAHRTESHGDTSPLDEFIRKQRQELVDSGLLDQETVSAFENENKETSEQPIESIKDSISKHNFLSESERYQEQAAASENMEDNSASETATFDLNETIVAPAITEADLDPSAPLLDDIDLSETQDLSEALSDTDSAFDEVPLVFADDAESNQEDTDTIAAETVDKIPTKPFYKRKGVLIGAFAALLLVLVAATGIYYITKQNSSASTEKTSSNATSKKDKDSFDNLYSTFFTDNKKTKLKNSEFTNLSKLKTQLDKLDGSDYYDDAKDKYNGLKKQIKAIQTVNNLFEGDAIIDGAYDKEVKVKSDSDFDNLSEDVTSTGNATLDRLIQDAIKGGKEQLAALASSSSSAAAAYSAPAASSSSATESSSGTVNSGSSSNSGSGSSSDSSSSTITTGGITNYDPATLQRSKSRVSYNESAVADTSNPAWTWGEGILEKIVSTAHSRGYFSGDNYILEPVNIVNGNGYYNMYLPDGTYLFSINCKTGYYVGNGSGHSDDLDY
ncbi:cell division site-positioning protein MapZ family protein [Streptococcus dentiloxodontae]